MVYKDFSQLTDKVRGFSALKRMVVAVAADAHTLEAALAARKEGMAAPVLVGDAAEIKRLLAELGESVPEEDIYDEADGAAACQKAVALVREGRGDFLMKGKIDTGVILKAVVNKEAGLGTGRLMSHFTIFEVPSYHKLLTAVDGGMVTYPDLTQKRQIIDNTVDTLLAMGYTEPKVGVVTCVEKPNPKMPETMDAAALAEMNRKGEIKNCIVDGPISYDVAVNKEIAELKGYAGATAGDVDVLIAPNIHTGNVMGKMLTCTAGARMAGIIVGAACPIVLTSRGSSADEKFLSIALAASMDKTN